MRLLLLHLSVLLSSSWVLDSGASFHVTSDQSHLASTTPVTEGTSVQTADGTLCHVTHKDSLSDSNFTVPNIFFVTELSMDLSVGQITDHNSFVGFDDLSCFVQDRHTGDMIGTGHRRKSSPRLYILDTLHLPSHHITTTHVLAASFPRRRSPNGIIVLVTYVDLVCLL